MIHALFVSLPFATITITITITITTVAGDCGATESSKLHFLVLKHEENNLKPADFKIRISLVLNFIQRSLQYFKLSLRLSKFY
jgi:hypothetical protein